MYGRAIHFQYSLAFLLRQRKWHHESETLQSFLDAVVNLESL